MGIVIDATGEETAPTVKSMIVRSGILIYAKVPFTNHISLIIKVF
jgi:hypothetical protein